MPPAPIGTFILWQGTVRCDWTSPWFYTWNFCICWGDTFNHKCCFLKYVSKLWSVVVSLITCGKVAWSFWHGIDRSSVTNSNCPIFWFNQLEARYQLSGSDEYVIGCVSIQFESDGSTPIWILSDKIISPLLGRFRTPTVNDSLIITETGWFGEKLTVWPWHGLVLLLLHLKLLSKLASFVQIHEFASLGFPVQS